MGDDSEHRDSEDVAAFDWTLLDSFLAGEGSPAEIARVQHWLETTPAARQLLAALDAEVERRDPLSPRAEGMMDTGVAWTRLARMSGAVATRGPVPPLLALTTYQRQRVPRWASLAASAAVLVSVSGVLGWWQRVRRETRPSAAALQEFATERGQRADVRLVDGTRVTLAPASRVRLAADYGGRGRDVYLDGAAYFVVHHDAAHPFAVHTRSAIVEDIGTEFLVHAYPGDSRAQVVVAEGTVALRVAPAGGGVPSPKAVLLGSGVLADVDSTGVTQVTSAARVNDYVGWREGRLIFRDTPVADVAREITRWYGVDVVLDDPRLRSLKFTASFAGEPVEAVVHAMADALGAPYEWIGRSVRMGRSANGSAPENGH